MKTFFKKKDSTGGKPVQKMSEQSCAIVNALNTAIDIFTSHSEEKFDDVMSNGLQSFAKAAGVQRIAIYRISQENGSIGQVYVWANGKTSFLDEELITVPGSPLVSRWFNILTKGECINLRVDKATKDEADFLTFFKVKSVFFVPIFTRNKLWGAVTLEDQINYRYFEDDCLDLLRSAARLCANAYMQMEMGQGSDKAYDTLKRREKLIKALNNTATVLLAQSSATFEDTMTAGIKYIADIIGLDRVSIWRNSNKFDGLHVSQIYRWDRESGGTTKPTAGLEDITYEKFAPRWEKFLAEGGSINSPVNFLPEAAMLQSFGVVSAFVIPVFSKKAFWGFVLFEDRRYERFFDDDVAETMRSAVYLCANAVVRTDMEREIIEANEFNRAVIDAAPIGLTVLDSNLHVIDCNEAVLKTYGGTKPLYIENFHDFSPEYQPDGLKSKDKSNELIRRALGGEKLVVEWMHRSASGEDIPSEVTLIPSQHKGMNIAFGFQYDLRNIKKLEKSVAEAEELTRSIMEANPISYVLFDENLQPIDCNETILKLLGCNDKQYFLEHYWDIFVPEKQIDKKSSHDKASVMMEKIYAGEQSNFEWNNKTLDGKIIPMENTMTQLMYKGKKIYVSFKYDLSSTKKLTEAFQTQSELLKIRLEQQELISDISRGFISSGDSEMYVKEAIAKLGHYHKVSQICIFGIVAKEKSTPLAYYWSTNGTPPKIADFDLFNFVISGFPERLPDCATVPVIPCEDISANSFKMFHPLLSVGIHAFICAPLYVDGHIWGILSVEQHSKPRKWTENEKSFVAVTASTIAGVIMRDIYNTKLKDAIRKLSAASMAKSEFLSNMSHEMRTPMNAIIGMTSIARNTPDLERKNYALEKIEDASSHLLGVINDVLDMSKIEANKLELSNTSFGFEKMLQKAISVINFRVEEKHQKLKIHVDKHIPEILVGDDQRLTQVITNLLSNAVKFTPEKGLISLDTRFLGEEDGICTIQISVTDNGIGISPDQQKRLFQSFQQAESSTVRKYGGTGLGLSISKNIVEMMGGKIWIESELNEGSTFAFTIKAKRGEEKTKNIYDQAENLDQIKILVVDDDSDILEFFTDVAQRYNLSCDVAEGGEDALRLIEKNGDYNVYFVDWKMPGIDGVTLTRTIKKIGNNYDNAIVVMISAGEWSEIEKDAKDAGVDRFLSKPLFPSAIPDTIGECLGIERQKNETEGSISDITFAGRRVLLTEDVEINREIVLTLLESTEVQIDCAENGLQSVQMFTENPGKYDMILMDVQMPEMDGYEATRCIRALESELEKQEGKPRKRIPIIAMTANVFREDVEKCLSAGMDDHIGKPLDFNEVLNKMRKYFGYV
ncbi:MAG: response regulator [Treponema sp.]|jgi:PAS domain S-box-containing protein|nr:response regulator [Treponema sp.]